MKQIITSVLYLVLLLCLSEFVFDPTNLYFELWWLDIPMHVLGGFGVAALTLAILRYKHRTISFLPVFASYITVALVWEVYEALCDFSAFGAYRGNWVDTVSDIINGALGALFAYFFLR